jgi:DNA-binding response OmpR family regulator
VYKILLVDDDKVSGKSLDKRLTQKGFSCVYVESGNDALEVIETINFDLVLLDIVMPNISGMEVLQKLRMKYNSFELPIIMVTAKGDASNVVDALRMNANDYLTKPVNIDVAIARINTQLKIKELMQTSLENQKMNTIHTMVTTLNHEINNPLAIAIGNLSLGIKRLDEDRIEKVMKALERISDIVKQIEQVTTGDLEEVEYIKNMNMYKFKKSK